MLHQFSLRHSLDPRRIPVATVDINMNGGKVSVLWLVRNWNHFSLSHPLVPGSGVEEVHLAGFVSHYKPCTFGRFLSNCC